MAGACVTPDKVSQFAAKDVNRLVGKIASVLARKSPYMDVLSGGTLEAGVSDTVRSVIQERAVLGASLTKPVFTADLQMCGTRGSQDQVGSTEYQYALESLRGRGPRICVKQARNAFMGTYLNAQQALEKGILQIINADIRSTLVQRGGVKVVCASNKAFGSLVTGGQQDIDTAFAALTPDAPMSWKLLRRIGAYLKYDLLAEPWESEQGTMFKVICSDELRESLRNEADIKEEMLALVKGRYQIGEEVITGFGWEGPYRGFAFGVDPQPLRATGLDGNGLPILVEPEIGVATTNGVAARVNPAWVNAPYEIAIILAADSFKRLVPEQYTGEGSFKFNPQLVAGELRWHYVLDNDCNEFGDYGQHLYQISRAHQPIRPHCAVAVIYQRCPLDTGLVTCDSSVNGL